MRTTENKLPGVRAAAVAAAIIALLISTSRIVLAGPENNPPRCPPHDWGSAQSEEKTCEISLSATGAVGKIGDTFSITATMSGTVGETKKFQICAKCGARNDLSPEPHVLSYSWSASAAGQSFSGTGLTASFKPTAAGSGTVTFTATCDKDGTVATASAAVEVVEVTSVTMEKSKIPIGDPVPEITVVTNPSGHETMVDLSEVDTSQPGSFQLKATCGTSEAAFDYQVVEILGILAPWSYKIPYSPVGGEHADCAFTVVTNPVGNGDMVEWSSSSGVCVLSNTNGSSVTATVPRFAIMRYTVTAAIGNSSDSGTISVEPGSLYVPAPSPQPRSVDVHGLPIARRKPQREEEIDQPKSLFEIGAGSLLPTYSVTDVSIPVGGSGDLRLEFRRSSSPSKERGPYGSTQFGENYSHPKILGDCWSSNVDCRAQLLGNSGRIAVYDENGGFYQYDQDGKPVVGKLSDAPAAQTSVEYDQASDVIIWRRKFGTVYRFAHKLPIAPGSTVFMHHLTSITDRNGNSVEYVYDGDTPFPSEIRDAARPEARLTIQYHQTPGVTPAQYRITSVSDPYGNTWNYSYRDRPNNPESLLVKVEAPEVPAASAAAPTAASPARPETLFDYQAVHFNGLGGYDMLGISSITDPEGNSIALTYQKLPYNGHEELALSTVVSADGTARFERALKTTTKLETRITDSAGHVWEYEFTDPFRVNDAASFLSQKRTLVATGETAFWKYSHDAESHAINLTEVTDRNGVEHQYVYGVDPATGYNHSKWNNVLREIQDPAGIAITKEFGYETTFNLMNKIVSPRGFEAGNSKADFTTTYTLDAHGNRLVESGSLGKTLRFEYDSTGFMTKSTDPDGRVTNFSRTHSPTGWTDSATATGYAGELSITTSRTYDLKGNLLSATDGNGNTTAYEYDAMGSLLKITKPTVFDAVSGADATPEILVTRDKNRQFLAKRNGKGVWTTYRYDAMYRLTDKTVDPGGLAIHSSWTYDHNGNKASSTDPRGTVTAFEYDAHNRLLSETVDPAGLNIVKSYAYGANCGNDVFGDSGFLPTSITDPKGIVEEFSYDNAYRLVSRKRAGLLLATMEYDAA